jgi:hypothetical protein
MVYSLDGKENQTLPLVDHYFSWIQDKHDKSYVDGSVILPELANGSHNIRVFLECNWQIGYSTGWKDNYYYDSEEVYFTVNNSTATSQSPTPIPTLSPSPTPTPTTTPITTPTPTQTPIVTPHTPTATPSPTPIFTPTQNPTPSTSSPTPSPTIPEYPAWIIPSVFLISHRERF